MRKKNIASVFLLVVVGMAVNALAFLTWDISHIVNDGVQYLSTAQHWIDGRGFSTNALIYGPHFQGILPAPQTVWPPGYPFALGLVTFTGLDLPLGGLVLNLLTHALAALLMYLVLRRLMVSRFCSALSAMLFYLMAMPWSFVTGVITEPVFTTLLLGALLALPDTRRSPSIVWLTCGVLMAMAVYVRFSAVFFSVGVGIGLFLFVILYDRPATIRGLSQALLKIGLLCLLPVLAFSQLMYRTQLLTGTLDRYSGSREPETLQSTVRQWVARTSEMLGFGQGDIFTASLWAPAFLLFAGLVTLIFCAFLVRTTTRIQHYLPQEAIRYSKRIMLVILCHSVGLVAYLSISNMSDTPLEIVTRYLYQIYSGVYILFCFVVYCLLRQYQLIHSVQRTLLYSTLSGIIGIYLLAQVNELSSSRVHFFEEGKMNKEAMHLAINKDDTLIDFIDACFTDHDPDTDTDTPNAVIWSTHGQHVQLHTGQSTITHADIYTSQPFTPAPFSQRISTYNISMFLFIGDQQNLDPDYQRYMREKKQWLINNGFAQIAMLENTVRGDKTVDVFVDKTECHGLEI